MIAALNDPTSAVRTLADLLAAAFGFAVTTAWLLVF